MDLGPVKTPWEATAQAVVTCGAVGLFVAAAVTKNEKNWKFRRVVARLVV